MTLGIEGTSTFNLTSVAADPLGRGQPDSDRSEEYGR